MGKLKDLRRLQIFRIECIPSIIKPGLRELRWYFESDTEKFGNTEVFEDKDFESMFEYVVEKSYRKLKDFYCLK